MFNKVTLRSYGYFLKFSKKIWLEKWIPPSRSKIAEIGKKTEGILGVYASSNLGALHYFWLLVSTTLILIEML
jgi:hypothetical protein